MNQVYLPIVWFVVASLLGVFLYRFAETKLQTKWLTISGSVLFVLVAVGLLSYFTERIVAASFLPSGSLIVRGAQLDDAETLAWEISNKNVEARRACVDVTRDDMACDEALRSLARATLQLGDLVGQMKKPTPVASAPSR